ncbi:MAG: hypothetical protein HFJ75_07755 [Eggerthellaceae bacterium]|nr:hypothetical protein [Eggerthellaceae bacterium]
MIGAPNPLIYDLCDDTVTVYRREADGTVSRVVHPRAFLDYTQVRTVGKTGSTDASTFLLVIPGDADVRKGDKVLLGEGPEIDGAAGWNSLIPAKVDGLVVVGSVDKKRWGGKVAHTEAGD